MLFAMFEKQVKDVLLVDKHKPQSHDTILAAMCSVAPWVAGKVTFLEKTLGELREEGGLPTGASVMGIHACGKVTDECIAIADHIGGNIALMPCCYQAPPPAVPVALQEALGRGLSLDAHRTYTLQHLGYQVSWSAIPSAITAKNRILLAKREGTQPTKATNAARSTRTARQPPVAPPAEQLPSGGSAAAAKGSAR
jgi:hypothetical protein